MVPFVLRIKEVNSENARFVRCRAWVCARREAGMDLRLI